MQETEDEMELVLGDLHKTKTELTKLKQVPLLYVPLSLIDVIRTHMYCDLSNGDCSGRIGGEGRGEGWGGGGGVGGRGRGGEGRRRGGAVSLHYSTHVHLLYSVSCDGSGHSLYNYIHEPSLSI